MAKQWTAFELQAHTGLQLEVVPMDMHPLSDATLGPEAGSNWNAVMVNTDWVATALNRGALLDLSDLIRSDPPEGYPDAWAPSMLRLQTVDGAVLGLPYHDGLAISAPLRERTDG